jgi:hypothetical protein
MPVSINKSLIALIVALCVVAVTSGASHASSATHVYPVKSADSVATSTTVLATAPRIFTWSNKAFIVGTTVKLSKLVTTKVKGVRTYRVSGFCSLRKGVLYFKYTGKCRATVSVQPNKGGKVLRSSKVLVAKAKTSSANWTTSVMPNLIGCVPASKDPVTGTKYPSTEPGFYEFQTGWTCTWDTMDARPLVEYFKSQGFVQKSTSMGMASADLRKGSNRVSYGPIFDRMPEGQAFLILTIYANGK